MEARIIVVSHKPYQMPKDPLYQPLLVGATGRSSFSSLWFQDDSEKNISQRNNTYCELTGHYWIWKNLDAEMVGLCHYRLYLGNRSFFLSRKRKVKENLILNGPQIDGLLKDHDSFGMKIQIMVAAHKPYWMPEDEIYLPIFVGAAGKQITPNYIRDDTGDNISQKNPTFCELSGLYWFWKHVDADVYGLCHYRRYLGSKGFRRKKTERLLSVEEIRHLLASSDIILPKKRHYWIETRESQYAHAHHVEDLECVEKILSERYPEYLSAWKWMLGTRSGHICNMFIMRKELFDEYCNWLFDILFEAERRLDISTYADKDKRVFGYLGERLLDVWVMTNKLNFVEKPMITLEDQHWIQKGFNFLKRKFQH